MLLRRIQSKSFRLADGVIFLTEYARKRVQEVIGELTTYSPVIPHGLSQRFQTEPREQRSIIDYTSTTPLRLLYVSIIDQYKHQWNVVEAVAALRHEGLPLILDLVGPAYSPSLVRLRKSLNRFDPDKNWVNYHGAIPYTDLHKIYAQADIGIFASSCENLPNILIETMADGLPIACSSCGPMPEVLGETGVYFDPEQPADIAKALRELIDLPQLRANKAYASYKRAQNYSWERCASDTFAFLAMIAFSYRNSSSEAS